MYLQRFLLPLALACLVSIAHANESQITFAHARFTVVTKNLIRLEYAAADDFTDNPTLFATERSTRFTDAKIEKTETSLTIDTGAIRLTYTPDGQPFHVGNLKAIIQRQDATVTWIPGAANPGNLGGTNRTLDGVAGPVPIAPGVLSRDGWALIDDSGMPILTNDWAASRPDKSTDDWYLFGYGLDYHAALRSLAAISGSVPLPRKNQLGIWYSRYWPYTSADYHQIVTEYTQHDFPLDNIVMDMDWHITQVPGARRAYANQVWTGYTWDRKLLPDAEELLKWFHSQGLFVTLNDHPADGVQPHEAMYADFMRAMGADPDSKKIIPFDAGDKNYLDTFWQYTHGPHQQEGVDFWWLDWQQYPNTRSIADLANLPWLNRYYYTQSTADNRRGASFSRWGGWGDHRYPIHFSGDAFTNWPMLAFEVPFTSTAGNAGCFFWTHDIGGHQGGRNEESYTRWCQFGALSAALRSHSTRNAAMDRRPWTYPQWAEMSMRESFQLRAQLFPYIYASAVESCDKTEPLLRPMYFESPENDESYQNAQEYYFGDDLLVAPIAMPGVGPSRLAWQTVWFPPGQGSWFNYFTGERYEAGTTALVAADINQFPLFFRAGAPVPMQPLTLRPATAPLNHLVIRCYPADDDRPHTFTLYEDDGQTQAYRTGQSAQTAITSIQGSQTAITITATEGRYTGQSLQRSYTIQLPCRDPAMRVTVDGVPQTSAYDPATSTITIDIPSRPIAQPTTVVLQAGVADFQRMHQQAVAGRLAGVVGQPVGDIHAALVAEKDRSLDPAILAAVGAGLVLRNDAPYLYHGVENYFEYEPAGLLDSHDGRLTLDSADSSHSIPVAIVPGVELITPEELKPLAADLTGQDTILVPGRQLTLCLTTKIARRDVTMTAPISGAIPSGSDLARSASVEASSTENSYDPRAVIDGVADGYPNNKSHEWAAGRKTASITLTWPTDQTANCILLYDRVDKVDHVLGGQIVFSDGSKIPFGELSSDPQTPVALNFPEKSVRWLRVEIQSVSPSTGSAGLSEIGVFHLENQ